MIRVSSRRKVQERGPHLAHTTQVIYLSRFAHRADHTGGADCRLLASSRICRFPGRNWGWHASSSDRDVDHHAADLDSFFAFRSLADVVGGRVLFRLFFEPRRRLDAAPAEAHGEGA